jgi:hypothetical protein
MKINSYLNQGIFFSTAIVLFLLTSNCATPLTEKEKAVIFVPNEQKYTFLLNDSCKIAKISQSSPDQYLLRQGAANLYESNVIQYFWGGMVSTDVVSANISGVARYWNCPVVPAELDEFKRDFD